jgi:hypothetical protein
MSIYGSKHRGTLSAVGWCQKANFRANARRYIPGHFVDIIGPNALVVIWERSIIRRNLLTWSLVSAMSHTSITAPLCLEIASIEATLMYRLQNEMNACCLTGLQIASHRSKCRNIPFHGRTSSAEHPALLK